MNSYPENTKHFKSGYVSIIGAPNAGKSTLLNRLLGEKLSITSRKAQTTRNRILGIVHGEDFQMIFADTPGIHSAKKLLNTKLVEVAVSSLEDTDVALFILDAKHPDPESEQLILRKLKGLKKPVILALNKIDLIQKGPAKRLVDEWKAAFPGHATVAVSAKHGEGIDTLLHSILDCIGYGPPFFPEDALTDVPQRFVVAEMIREKVFRFTGEEIPYSIAVTIESFQEKPENGLARIHAVIHVEKNSQKGIVIGKKGQLLKKIGYEARKDIERFLEQKVYLELFVRVQKNWSKDAKALKKFGY